MVGRRYFCTKRIAYCTVIPEKVMGAREYWNKIDLFCSYRVSLKIYTFARTCYNMARAPKLAVPGVVSGLCKTQQRNRCSLSASNILVRVSAFPFSILLRLRLAVLLMYALFTHQ